MGKDTAALITKAEGLLKSCQKLFEKADEKKISALAAIREASFGTYGEAKSTEETLKQQLTRFRVGCEKVELNGQLMESVLKSLNKKIKVKNFLSIFKTQKSLDEAKACAEKLEKALKHTEKTAITNNAYYKEAVKLAKGTVKKLKEQEAELKKQEKLNAKQKEKKN